MINLAAWFWQWTCLKLSQSSQLHSQENGLGWAHSLLILTLAPLGRKWKEEEEEDFHVVLKLFLVKILMAHLWVECQEHIGDRSTKVPMVCFRYGALPSPDTVRECSNLPRLLVFFFFFLGDIILVCKSGAFFNISAFIVLLIYLLKTSPWIKLLIAGVLYLVSVG